MADDGPDTDRSGSAGYRPAGAGETARANRSWWDAQADDYLAEHGEFLGGRLVWGPEGLAEDDARLLGDVAGRRVLEVGAGAAQCSAWLARRGATVLACDLSVGMLRYGRPLPRVQCDARALPYADDSFDLAFSSYGAIPFVADPDRVMREVARVLRPGGRWVFSVTHPIRWAFPDDPGRSGLTVQRSYFDTTPYVETRADGRVSYAEHHRTLGQRVQDLVAAGFVLDALVEPPWPEGHEESWGGWSPLRGRLLPGTAVFVSHLPG
jgi:SAM-dependent methyltransferase